MMISRALRKKLKSISKKAKLRIFLCFIMYSKQEIVVYNTPHKCQSAIKDLVIIVTKKM